MRRPTPVLWILALSALALAWPSHPASAGPAKRYGAEGMLLGYDAAKDVFKVKITSPRVQGGFGSGGIAGASAPGLKSGEELEFGVVPEGSVLRRTVIKASKGGGLDNSGTKEGFEKAVEAIPRDRPIVLSFEENQGGAASPGDAPKYLLKMVQIRMSPEEIQKRLREIGLSQDEIDQAQHQGESGQGGN